MPIEDGTQSASGAEPNAPQVSDDPDQRQLDEALAELAREDAEPQAQGNEGAAQEQSQAAQKPAAEQTAQPQGDGRAAQADQQAQPQGDARAQQQPEPVVPVGRLRREAEARRAAEEHARNALAEAERLRAQNEALTRIAKGEPAASRQPGTADAIEAELDKLAERYEAGQVSESEYRKQQRTLNKQLSRIEQEALLARIEERVKAPAPQTSAAETRRLAQESSQIVTQHPYLEHLADEDMKFLTRRAVQDLREEGVEFPANGQLSAEDRIMVRQRVGQLSDRFGPVMTGLDLRPKPAAGAQGNVQGSVPVQGRQANPQTPAMPSMAQARARALADARSAPPDISTMGQGKTDEGISKEQFLAMSEVEIEALPEATRQRLYSRYG